MNRIERHDAYKTKLESALFGEGLFEYRNQTKGDLYLQKPAKDGRRQIPPGGTFQGDSYFKNKEGILHTKTIQSVDAARAEKLKENNSILEESTMSEEKLIVDQPEQVTSEGAVEHVKKTPEPVKPLNEQKPHVEGQQERKDVLLNDAPISGVEILLNH